jgi:hypothetical protein
MSTTEVTEATEKIPMFWLGVLGVLGVLGGDTQLRPKRAAAGITHVPDRDV